MRKMEEEEEIQQSHLPQHEEIIENKPDNSMETEKGYVKAISDDQNHPYEETKELKSEDGREKQDPVSDAEKVGEESKRKEKLGISSQKGKSKAEGKQKAKHTVPQPFSLATEKRISERERRRWLDSEQPVLKSTGFIYKYPTQTSQRVERITQLRHGTVPAKSTSQRCRPIDKPTEKNQEEVKDLEIKKPRKSSASKALPLPNFDKKAPKKPEIKRIPLRRPKSPPLHQVHRSISESLHRRSKSISELSSNKTEAFKRSKSICESGNNKMEAIAQNSSKTTSVGAMSSESRTTKPEAVQRRSKSISELSNNKREAFNRSKSICELGDNKMGVTIKNGSKTPTKGGASSESRTTKSEAIQKGTSRSISSSAKEAINRMLRGSWKPSNKQQRESVKGGKSCGGGLGKDGGISSNEGKGLAISG